MKAWRSREKRLNYRNALLAAVMANCMGDGKKQWQPSDFVQKDAEDIQREYAENEAHIKANFLKYETLRKAGNSI
jgi:hypothetical protein